MERSAGPVTRGSGARRGSDLGSRKAGRAAGTRSAVTTSRPTLRAPGSDPEPRDEATETPEPTDSRASASGEPVSRMTEADAEEEAQPVDDGARTLGKACMYGTRGQVIYRPRGAACRGDAHPAPSRALGRGARPQVARPSPAAADPVARRDTPRRAAGRAEPAQAPKARGRCIIGGDGRVVHAPPGVDCRR